MSLKSPWEFKCITYYQTEHIKVLDTNTCETLQVVKGSAAVMEVTRQMETAAQVQANLCL